MGRQLASSRHGVLRNFPSHFHYLLNLLGFGRPALVFAVIRVFYTHPHHFPSRIYRGRFLALRNKQRLCLASTACWAEAYGGLPVAALGILATHNRLF